MAYIPKEIVCGYQYADEPQVGTKTFLNYVKPDGTLNCEKSFNKWCSKNYSGTRVTIPNEPVSGFKIIHTVGGGSGDIRQAYVEIEDPRGFRFEITDEEFINICKNYSVAKGVIEGTYVYGFGHATSHMLLNIDSKEYADSVKATEFQNTAHTNESKKFTTKDLIQGRAYVVLDGSTMRKVCYIGNIHEWNYHHDKKASKHIFATLDYCKTKAFSASKIIKDLNITLATKEDCEAFVAEHAEIRYDSIWKLSYSTFIKDIYEKHNEMD